MNGTSPRIGLQILFLLILTATAHAIYVSSTPHYVAYAPIVSITDEDTIDTTLSEVSKVVRITADSSNPNSTIIRFSLFASDGRNSRNTQVADFNISACFLHPTQFGDCFESYHCGDALPYSFDSIENFSNGKWSYFELKIPDNRSNDSFGKIQVTIMYKLKKAVSTTLSSMHYYWYGFQCYNDNCPPDGSNGLRKNILFLQNDDWNIEYSSPNSNASLDPLVEKNNLFILSTNRYFYSDHVSYSRPIETAVNDPLKWAYIGAFLGALISALIVSPVFEFIQKLIDSEIKHVFLQWCIVSIVSIGVCLILGNYLSNAALEVFSFSGICGILIAAAIFFVLTKYFFIVKRENKNKTISKTKRK